MWFYRYTDELRHHGILGMKWGVRRYQNKDGTLTAAGKKQAANNEKKKAADKKDKKASKRGIVEKTKTFLRALEEVAVKQEDERRKDVYENAMTGKQKKSIRQTGRQ